MIHMPNPGSKALRIGRKSIPGALYLITKHLAQSAGGVLAEPGNADVFLDCLFRIQKKNLFNLIAFVVMPSHYHLIVQLGDTVSLSMAIGKLNESFSRAAKDKLPPGSIWQTGFHDHLIRPNEDPFEFIKYVLDNPVREGLVEKPEDWAYSSAHPAFRGRMGWI